MATPQASENPLLVFPSIFDSTDHTTTSFWLKPSNETPRTKTKRQPDPQQQKTISGPLHHCSSKSLYPKWKSCTYELIENKLYRTREDEVIPSSYVIIDNFRLEKLKSSTDNDVFRYGFRLITNQLFLELFCTSKEQMQTWFEALKPFCVLTSFALDYTTVKLIGKGNFGRVYLARSKNSSSSSQLPIEEFAVKAFDKSKFSSIDVDRSALIKEISILRSINHPHLIRMHEVYETDTHIFLVNELLKGGELFHIINDKSPPSSTASLPSASSSSSTQFTTTFSESKAALIIAKLLDALNYLCSKNILHRDIKPENLILRNRITSTTSQSIDICLADFGLADYFDPKGQYMFTRCGTPGYVAPEVLADKPYDFKVDVFSVGVIMYILLSGSSPFAGKTYNDIVEKNFVCDIDFSRFNSPPVTAAAASGDAQPPTSFTSEAKDLLMKLLKKDPAERITASQAMHHSWLQRANVSLNSQVQIRKLAKIIKGVGNSPASRRNEQQQHQLQQQTSLDDIRSPTASTHMMGQPSFSRAVQLTQMQSTITKPQPMPYKILVKSTSMMIPTKNESLMSSQLPLPPPNSNLHKIRLPDIKSPRISVGSPKNYENTFQYKDNSISAATTTNNHNNSSTQLMNSFSRVMSLNNNYSTISASAARNLTDSNKQQQSSKQQQQEHIAHQYNDQSHNFQSLQKNTSTLTASNSSGESQSQHRSSIVKSPVTPFNTSHIGLAAQFLLKHSSASTASSPEDLANHHQYHHHHQLQPLKLNTHLTSSDSPSTLKLPLINRSLQISPNDIHEDSLSQMKNGSMTTTAAAAKLSSVKRRRQQFFNDQQQQQPPPLTTGRDIIDSPLLADKQPTRISYAKSIREKLILNLQ